MEADDPLGSEECSNKLQGTESYFLFKLVWKSTILSQVTKKRHHFGSLFQCFDTDTTFLTPKNYEIQLRNVLGVALARVSTQLKSALRREARHVAEPRPAGGVSAAVACRGRGVRAFHIRQRCTASRSAAYPQRSMHPHRTSALWPILTQNFDYHFCHKSYNFVMNF